MIPFDMGLMLAELIEQLKAEIAAEKERMRQKEKVC